MFEAIKTRALEGSNYSSDDSGTLAVSASAWVFIAAISVLVAFGIVWSVLRATLPDVYY